MENNELTAVKAAMPSLEGLPQEVIEYVLGLVAENARMDDFVDKCLHAAWQGGDLDGAEIQYLALKCGLLREEVYSADQHEILVEDPSNFEDGNAVYFRTEITNTDAAIAEIKARGLDDFKAWSDSHIEEGDEYEKSLREVSKALSIFAANLRAARKG